MREAQPETGASRLPRGPQGRRRSRCAFALLAVVAGSACEVFPYSPHEVRLSDSETGLTQKNLDRIRMLEPGEIVRFAVLGDTQGWMTETRDAIDAVNRIDDLDFVIQVGDITDFGFAREFRWAQRWFSQANRPFLTAIGNHDLLSNGRAIYRAMFGETDYSFDLASVRFVVLDDNSREYDFDGSIPNLDWLEGQLDRGGSYDRAVVLSHVPPWDGDFDPSLARRFTEILQRGGAMLSVHGHVHAFEDRVAAGGLRFVVADSIDKRNLLLLSVGPEEVTVERIFF